MKLLYTPRSPYARKVRVAAIEKGIELELVSEDLINKSPGLVKANPLGKIPTLVLDDGSGIFDSPVICEYLDSLKAKPALLPRDPDKRFAVLTLAAAADGLMDATVAAFMEKRRHPDDFNAAFVAVQEETARQCLAYFDAQVEQFKELNLAGIGVASAIGYMHFRLPHLWPAFPLRPRSEASGEAPAEWRGRQTSANLTSSPKGRRPGRPSSNCPRLARWYEEFSKRKSMQETVPREK